jgi:hypothetical protein
MSEQKGGCLRGLFALVIAPLIVTVAAGLVFEWYRSRDKTPVPPAVANPKALSPVATMIIGKWNVDKQSTIYGEKSVEFTATGQMIRTTTAVIRGDNSTDYKYKVNEEGQLEVISTDKVVLIKLTEDELTLKWDGSISSYTRAWPEWLRSIVFGGAAILFIVVAIMYQIAKRR